jgi:YD repeat-containing protein
MLDLTPSQLYYSDQWQVLESRRSTGATIEQYVWSNAFVDGIVERDRDADNDPSTGSYGKSGSGLEQRLYALQDANWNTTAVVDTSGVVVERYQYDPYGAVTVLNGNLLEPDVADWSTTGEDGRSDAAQ